MFSCCKMTYQKACNFKRKRIEVSEQLVFDAGRDYLQKLRFSTFVSLYKGTECPQYQSAFNETKKALEKYLKALEFCYDSIHFDIKEILD